MAALAGHPLLAAARGAPAAAATAPGVASAAAMRAHQQQQQQQQQAAAAAAGTRSAGAAAAGASGRKRKQPEKPAAAKPLHLVPEAALFNSLILQEHQLDDLIRRKRLEIQAAAHPFDTPPPRRLRVYVYATHAHQAGPPGSSGGGGGSGSQGEPGPGPGPGPATQPQQQPQPGQPQEPPQWTLCVWGRLLDEPGSGGPASPGGAAQQQQQQQQQGGKQPFTSFFRRITVQLDAAQFPGERGRLVWDKLQHRGVHKDRLEVKRMGDQPVEVSITLEQDFAPTAHALDPRLAEVLGMPFGYQAAVLARLYQYIASKTPQSDLAQLQLDEPLAAIFGTKQLPAAELPVALGKLLSPIQPVTIRHTIDVHGPSPGAVTCVDVDVLPPAKPAERLFPSIDSLLDEKQLDAAEAKLMAQLTKLFEARRRRAMYLGFAEDPVAFMNAVIAGQARELRVSRTNRDAEVERRTDAFREKWVDEAATRYLGKRNGQE